MCTQCSKNLRNKGIVLLMGHKDMADTKSSRVSACALMTGCEGRYLEVEWQAGGGTHICLFMQKQRNNCNSLCTFLTLSRCITVIKRISTQLHWTVIRLDKVAFQFHLCQTENIFVLWRWWHHDNWECFCAFKRNLKGKSPSVQSFSPAKCVCVCLSSILNDV